ncbi:MAG: hypothetical protein JJE34_03980 [Alphaproteobacteria bacterium]|nr:hypothetical protein [Alphaproteobacteria bacterium]
MSRSRHIVALALLAAALPLMASAAEAEAPERVTTLVVYGDDPCPVESSDAIVVCARKPESERYRIPKSLREKKAVVGSQGWANRVATMEGKGRQSLPNSCSVIGSNGQTGCTQAMLRQWFDERRLAKEEAADIP